MGHPWKDQVQKQRQAVADARNVKWAELTPAQQLEALDRRLGKGVGAKKQRLKIQAKIDAARESSPTDTKKKQKGK